MTTTDWKAESKAREDATHAACAELVPPLTELSQPIACSAKAIGDDRRWSDEASHFHVSLQRGARVFGFEYSKGSGHRAWKKLARFHDAPGAVNRAQPPSHWLSKYPPHERNGNVRAWILRNSEAPPPTLAEIIECLDSDAGVLGTTFEDWCADFGYDPDSRKAEASYRACDEQAKRMLAVLSREELATLAAIHRGD